MGVGRNMLQGRLTIIVLALLLAATVPAADSPGIQSFLASCAQKTGRLLQPGEYRVRYLGDTPAMASRLLALVQTGEKSITFSTPRLYRDDRNLTPKRGSFTVLTDFEGRPGALLRTSWVRIKPFSKVSERESRYEGKPVRPIAAWRKVHWEFFTRTLAPFGEQPSEDLPVSIEKFELLCRG
jgi:uncharacterized protein YhfF